MEKKKLAWRVYRIESEDDLKHALLHYHTATELKPVLARVGERAPDELIKWVERLGIEVVQAKDVLPWDVWLRHVKGGVTEQMKLL